MNNYAPAPIPLGLSNVVGIAVGFDLCLAVKDDETVLGWGHPSFGEKSRSDRLEQRSGCCGGHVLWVGSEISIGTVWDGAITAKARKLHPRRTKQCRFHRGRALPQRCLEGHGTVVGWGDNF